MKKKNYTSPAATNVQFGETAMQLKGLGIHETPGVN